MSVDTFSDEVKKLIFKIHTAFEGVALDDGIGIFEANALDDYFEKGSEVCNYAHQRDRSETQFMGWKSLLAKVSDFGWSSAAWWFMDSKGRRFTLPAFLISLLLYRRYEYEYQMMKNCEKDDRTFCICDTDFNLPYKFSSFEFCHELLLVLSKDQVDCVKDFASLMISYPCPACPEEKKDYQKLNEDLNVYLNIINKEDLNNKT